jgi:hypothetical protein
MTTAPLLAFAFASGVTLHNLEEGLSLAEWERQHMKLWFRPDRRAFLIGTTLVSAWTWIAVLWPIDGVLSGVALAMAANALFQHLPLSLLKRSYMPGTATGLLLNLPLGLSLLDGHSADWPVILGYAIGFGVLSFAGLALAHILVARANAAS